MKSKYRTILILSNVLMLLTACNEQSNNLNIMGEHRDSYTPIYVTQDDNVNSIDYGKENTGTYKVNEDGSINIDMTLLDDNENMQANNSNKSQFELNQELNSDNTSADTEELKDRFGISNQISAISVVNEITKIADRDNFYSVEIVDSSENDESNSDTVEYIVRFDKYDYYVITYYIGEGCVSYHDDTGYLASAYGENEEDEEWFDE